MASHSDGEDEGGSFWNIGRRSWKRYSKKKSSSTPDMRPKVEGHSREANAAMMTGILKGKLAVFPGGVDRLGRPVIVIPSRKQAKFSMDDLGASLTYLAKIPSQDLKDKGFTILLDLRGATWKDLKPLLRTIDDSLLNCKQVYVIKPDDFWEKRRSSLGYKTHKTYHDFETTLVSSIHKLQQFIDPSQLTSDYGGYLFYDHDDWIQIRQLIERFAKSYSITFRQLNNLTEELDDKTLGDDMVETKNLISDHEALYQRIHELSSAVIPIGEDILDALRTHTDDSHQDQPVKYRMEIEKMNVDAALKNVKLKHKGVLDAWQRRKRMLEQCLKFQEYERGYQKVVEWVTGIGFDRLSSTNEIGDSLTEAEALKKEHEEFERATKDYIVLFGKLRENSKDMIQDEHYAAKEIKHRKRYLDMVCKSFADYMEKKRKLLNTSIRFHRYAREFARRLDDLLDLLCTETETLAEDVNTAEHMLDSLKQMTDGVNTASENTAREAQKLKSVMKDPIYSATGTDITPDYTSAIRHIQIVFDDLNDRKLRSDELCDVRKLKLQQCLQLRTCERDADQAITWMKELCEVMLSTHTDLGRSMEEAEHLAKEHSKFENTARGTYEYGKQLLSAALVLRRSCRYDLGSNQDKMQELNQIWKTFEAGIEERGMRLDIALEFHSEAEKALEGLRSLKDQGLLLPDTDAEDTAYSLEGARLALHDQFSHAIEVGNTLITRISQPLIVGSDVTDFPLALNREDEVERLVEDLKEKQELIDKLIEDSQASPSLAKTVPVALPTTSTPHNEEFVPMTASSLYEVSSTPLDLKLLEEEENLTIRLEEAIRWLESTVIVPLEEEQSVGESVEEAEKLMSDHSMLEEQLKDKEAEVLECQEAAQDFHERSLTFDDSLPSAEKGLINTWTKALKEVQARRKLLVTSLEFHQSAKRFSKVIENAMESLESPPILANNVTKAKSVLSEHHELRKDILELSMDTLSKGQILLEKLRETTSRADINCRHATKSACYGIERTLEGLHSRRRKLENMWKQRRKILEQCLKSCKLDEEMRRAIDWLQGEGENYISTNDHFGDTAQETERLIEAHNDFDRTFREKYDFSQKIIRDGQKLIHGAHYDSSSLKYKISKLEEMFQDFKSQMDHRKKILSQTLSLYHSIQPDIGPDEV